MRRAMVNPERQHLIEEVEVDEALVDLHLLDQMLAFGIDHRPAHCAASSTPSRTGATRAGAATAARRPPASACSSGTPPRTTDAMACASCAAPCPPSPTPGSGMPSTAIAC